MLQLKDNGSVLCSANQAYYQLRNLQPSFFFLFFLLEGGGEEGEQVLGISEGVGHARNKDGFYIVHYSQAKSITRGLTRRQEWQAELCLFGSPLCLNEPVLLCQGGSLPLILLL